jgi:hypothetical protein
VLGGHAADLAGVGQVGHRGAVPAGVYALGTTRQPSFWREEMIGERVAGALVTGTTPSPSRVHMRLTLAAIHVNRGHMILVICGPE